MLIPKALVALAWALVFGLAIGLPLGWGFSQFHRPAEQAKPNNHRHPAQPENQNSDSGNTNTAKDHSGKHGNESGQEGRWYDTFLDHTPDWFVAAFTAVLSVITFLLVRSTNRLWEAGERQLGLAERQFVTTNRPRVTVQFIQGPLTYTESGRVGAAVTVANIGPSDATIFALGCDIGIRRGNRWASNIDGTTKPISPIVLRSGQRHTVEVEAREGDGDDNFYFAWGFMRAAAEGRRTASPDEAVAIAGEIVYRDAIGIERHTGFLRVYDSESERWVPDKDPGNEHED
ncbi:hypothetical protein BH10PSE6_BH10PSE6_47990 [soil metagenome]